MALGVRLFERSTRRVQITAAGREFAAVAERMLNDLGITVQSVREVAEERRGLVVDIERDVGQRAACCPASSRPTAADRPGVEIHVARGRACRRPRGCPQRRRRLRHRLRRRAARLRRRHGAQPRDLLRRDAGAPQAGRPARPVSCPSCATSRWSGCRPRSRTRRTIDAAAATSGVPLRQAVVVSQFATLMALVGAGVGIAVVPKGATQGPLARGLRIVPLVEPRLLAPARPDRVARARADARGGRLRGAAAPSMAANRLMRSLATIRLSGWPWHSGAPTMLGLGGSRAASRIPRLRSRQHLGGPGALSLQRLDRRPADRAADGRGGARVPRLGDDAARPADRHRAGARARRSPPRSSRSTP